MSDVDRAGSPLAQWMLTDYGPVDEQVQIQVGRVESGYYVDHTGFGRRPYPDRQAAWDAVRSLMGHHQGNWRETPCDDAPFAELRPPDGSRVVYDTDGNCLWGHWGDLKDTRWERYQAAMNAGHPFRSTETHSALGGLVEAIAIREPETGLDRYVVATALEEGTDYYVVEYPDRDVAATAYEKAVYANRSDALPYKSSDIREITVERDSIVPERMVMLDDGGFMPEEDYEELYGPPPSPITWIRMPPLENTGRVGPMTADPRDWGPGDARLTDVTPAAWAAPDPALEPKDLALLTLADGRQLLASAHDGAAHVWNVREGAPLRTIVGHDERVLSVALVTLYDGRVVLATGGQDGYAKVWDTGDGQLLRELTMENRTPVNTVSWVCSPGTVPWLITAGDDAMVRVWNPAQARTVAELPLGEPRANVVWSVDATVLANGNVCVVAGSYLGLDVSVHVWDVTAGTPPRQFVLNEVDPNRSTVDVAIVPVADRSFRVAAAVGPAVWVWDGFTGDVVRSFSLPENRDSAVALAALPDLRVAVAAIGGGRTIVWDTESGVELASVTRPEGRWPEVVDLAATPGGELLLAAKHGNRAPAGLLRLAISEDAR